MVRNKLKTSEIFLTIRYRNDDMGRKSPERQSTPFAPAAPMIIGLAPQETFLSFFKAKCDKGIWLEKEQLPDLNLIPHKQFRVPFSHIYFYHVFFFGIERNASYAVKL